MNIKKIRPMFTRIVTTMNKYVEEGGELITDLSKLKTGLTEYQTVIAVGSSVRDINVGDLVCINPDRYKVKQFKEDSLKNDLMTNQVVRYNFDTVRIDGKDCLLLDNNDIEFVVEEYED